MMEDELILVSVTACSRRKLSELGLTNILDHLAASCCIYLGLMTSI